MDGSEFSSQTAAAAAMQPPGLPGQIGDVIAVSGFRLTCKLYRVNAPGSPGGYADAQIGALVKIATSQSMAFGFIDSLELLHAADGDPSTAMAIAQIDLLGELISSRPGKPPSFARGISVFPVLGAPLFVATPDDLSLIYARPDTWTMVIGSLFQDIEKPAYLLSQEFLSCGPC
jgi:hypothetical protein